MLTIAIVIVSIAISLASLKDVMIEQRQRIEAYDDRHIEAHHQIAGDLAYIARLLELHDTEFDQTKAAIINALGNLSASQRRRDTMPDRARFRLY